jgi:hypothetical protein
MRKNSADVVGTSYAMMQISHSGPRRFSAPKDRWTSSLDLCSALGTTLRGINHANSCRTESQRLAQAYTCRENIAACELVAKELMPSICAQLQQEWLAVNVLAFGRYLRWVSHFFYWPWQLRIRQCCLVPAYG